MNDLDPDGVGIDILSEDKGYIVWTYGSTLTWTISDLAQSDRTLGLLRAS